MKRNCGRAVSYTHLDVYKRQGMGRMMQETALQLGYDDIAFLDDAKKEKDVIGKCCDYEEFLKVYDSAIAAFGDNNMRLLWTERLMEAGYEVPSLIHPSAVVSPNAIVGRGCFVLQRAVVNRDTVMEHAVLINSGAVVDHDTHLSKGVHIGLGSVVKAHCKISAGVRVEAGEVIFSTRMKIDGVDNRNLEDAVYAFGLSLIHIFQVLNEPELTPETDSWMWLFRSGEDGLPRCV